MSRNLEATTQPRVDLYGMVHKGVRRSLFDTMARLGSADLREPAVARRSAAEVEALLQVLEHHAHVENTHVQPRLETLAPYVAGVLGRDHEALDRDMAELEALAVALAGAPPSRVALGRELYRRLGLLVAAQLQHMAREEDQGNRALWACLSDESLLEIHGRILASLTPDQLLEHAAWMTPALDPEERERLLGGVARKAPAHVLARLLERLRAVMEPEDFGRLAVALPRPE